MTTLRALWRFLASPTCDLRTGDEFVTFDGLIGAGLLVFVIGCITGVLQ